MRMNMNHWFQKAKRDERGIKCTGHNIMGGHTPIAVAAVLY